MSRPSQIEKILEMARKTGALRVRDLIAHGLHPENLRRLSARGILVRSGRGLYMLADVDATENHTFVEAAKKVPQGVICLLSALRFHGLTTQAPFEVWMAIAGKAWRPKADYPPLRVFHFSESALNFGVEVHQIEGVPVRIFSPSKTVVDCFKYRNKIGLDVAVESLRDCRRQRKCKNDELWRYAKVCRVSNVMRPYLEATI